MAVTVNAEGQVEDEILGHFHCFPNPLNSFPEFQISVLKISKDFTINVTIQSYTYTLKF
jgi:hypothetical protein